MRKCRQNGWFWEKMFAEKSKSIYLCKIKRDKIKQKTSNYYQLIKIKIMARPIEETPVITGEDAERFLEEIKNPIPESPEKIEYARKIYERLKISEALGF